MTAEALKSDDPRIQHKFFTIPGTDLKYHYLLGRPNRPAKATILLLHGFPDLAIGWRYQVPFLLDQLGLQVIVPDMLGYNQSSHPAAVEEYTFKKLSAHMAHLIHEVVGPGQQILLGGHDWGAYLVWRLAIWHPELIYAVFSLCVPFTTPNPTYWDLPRLVARIPTMQYQQQFADPQLNATLDANVAKLRGFFNLVYNGKLEGEVENGWNMGMDIARLEQVGPATSMSPEVVEQYVEAFQKNGMTGPFNWYRTRRLNYEDELVFAKRDKLHKFTMPAMLVMASRDVALPPALAQGQGKFFKGGLKQVTVDASHWVGVEKPEEVNRLIAEFVKDVLRGDSARGKL